MQDDERNEALGMDDGDKVRVSICFCALSGLR